MEIKNLDQFKEICPTDAFAAFAESAREGDPDFLLDTLAELEIKDHIKNQLQIQKKPMWVEFYTKMQEFEPLTFDLDQIEKDINNLI